MKITALSANALLASALAITPASATLTPLADVVQVSVGGAPQGAALGSFGCAVTSAGGVKCWGTNGSGELGDGSVSPPRDHAADVSGLTSGVQAVTTSTSTDGAHACALMGGGAVKCWGANTTGQLGNGTTTPSPVPVDVVGLGAPALAISAGARHTCAVITGGTLKCWGDNGFGQLGDGTNAMRTAPVDVTGLTGVASVSAGASHTCAVSTLGGLKCWGENLRGALGDGTTTSRPTPGDVPGLTSGVASVDTGGLSGGYLMPTSATHTCALMASGGVKCWGANGSGQLGEGTTNDRLVPFDVLGLTSGAASMSAGGYASYCLQCGLANKWQPDGLTCAAMASGAVKCWGPTPQDVASLPAPASAVSSGGARTCALLSDGRVACWTRTQPSPTVLLSGTAAQTISVTILPTDVPLGEQRGLAASASSGLPVAATSLTPSICSVAGGSVPYTHTVTSIADGRCEIALDQAGSVAWDPAPQAVVAIRSGAGIAQTIAFGPAPTLVVQGAAHLSAAASSGLPVAFTSTTPSICTVSGDVVIGVAVGSCTILATQPGDAWYAPATPQVTQTFPVGANDGTYGLVVSKSGGTGTVTSAPGAISCGATCAANFPGGTTVALTATPAAGWSFVGWGGDCTGSGACSVAMTAVRSVTATFAVTTRLGNISTRGQVLTGNDVMIGGFVIGGTTPKTVVVRARGPSLIPFGIVNPLQNPLLQLVRSSDQQQLAVSDNWQANSNHQDIAASGFAPTDPLEAAILTPLAPGAYTAIVSGAGNTTGVGIVEVFEVDAPESPLVNLSTRGQVLTGNDVMIGGFVIQGTTPQRVVIRARGPSLIPFGIANALPNPQLQLMRSSDQQPLAFNDDWQSAANAAEVTASGFAPSNALESAILVTLPPGAYTAIVTGAGGATGVGIVEVFWAP